MQILSFQSRVAYGHVGNSAAVFALQRLGHDAWTVDTVSFSNHPGHGQFTGTVTAPERLDELVGGLERLGLPARLDGLLSGYLGSPHAVPALNRLLDGLCPGALYVLDPVMGDDGPGLYVQPGIPEAMAAALLPRARLITPNRFELALLSGLPVGNLDEARIAARALLVQGPEMVVVTSLCPDTGTIACLGVTEQDSWVVATPRLEFEQPPNGAGDLLSALLTARLLEGKSLPDALSLAASGVWGVLKVTQGGDGRELALVLAQGELGTPSRLFRAETV